MKHIIKLLDQIWLKLMQVTLILIGKTLAEPYTEEEKQNMLRKLAEARRKNLAMITLTREEYEAFLEIEFRDLTDETRVHNNEVILMRNRY